MYCVTVADRKSEEGTGGGQSVMSCSRQGDDMCSMNLTVCKLIPKRNNLATLQENNAFFNGFSSSCSPSAAILNHDYNHGAVAARSSINRKLHQRWRAVQPTTIIIPYGNYRFVWVMWINVVLHESIKCIKWLGKRRRAGALPSSPPAETHR